MSTRSRTASTIGGFAACAVLAATSPVWATSGHSTPVGHATDKSSVNAATITMLRAEVAKLRAEVIADHAALREAAKADRAMARSATRSRAAAAHWRTLAHRTPAPRTVVVTKRVATDPNSTDPMATKRCHHQHGVDPADWSGSNDPRWHHHCHHGDQGGHNGPAGFRH